MNKTAHVIMNDIIDQILQHAIVALWFDSTQLVSPLFANWSVTAEHFIGAYVTGCNSLYVDSYAVEREREGG